MNMQRVSVADAGGHLAELIAAAQRGEHIVIEDEQHNQVKLVALPRMPKSRVLGLHAGLVELGEGFEAPLPDAFWLER